MDLKDMKNCAPKPGSVNDGVCVSSDATTTQFRQGTVNPSLQRTRASSPPTTVQSTLPFPGREIVVNDGAWSPQTDHPGAADVHFQNLRASHLPEEDSDLDFQAVWKLVDMTPSISDKTLVFVDFAAWLHQLYVADSLLAASTATWLYARRALADFGLAKRVLTGLLERWWAAFASPVSQGMGEMAQKGARFLSSLQRSPVILAFRHLVGAVIGLQLFDAERIPAVLERFKLEPPSSGYDLIVRSLESLGRVIDAGESIWEGRLTWRQVLTGAGQDELQAKIDYVRNYRNLYFTGLEMPGRVSERNLYKMVVEAQTLLDELRRNVPRQTSTGSRYQELYVELTLVREELDNARRSRNRRAPLGIILTGPSRAGKSTIIRILLAACARAYGVSLEGRDIGEFIFTKPRSSQYYDGYDASMPFLHFPEVGATHVNIASKQGDQDLVQFLGLSDNSGLILDYAELTKKGKYSMLADVLLTDTNVPGLNAHAVVNNPAAILARFLRVEISVKKDYLQDPLSGAVDFQKVTAAGAELDAWNWRFVRVIPHANNVDYSEEIHMWRQPDGSTRPAVFSSASEASEFMEHLARQHLEKQEAVVANQKRACTILPGQLDVPKLEPLEQVPFPQWQGASESRLRADSDDTITEEYCTDLPAEFEISWKTSALHQIQELRERRRHYWQRAADKFHSARDWCNGWACQTLEAGASYTFVSLGCFCLWILQGVLDAAAFEGVWAFALRRTLTVAQVQLRSSRVLKRLELRSCFIPGPWLPQPTERTAHLLALAGGIATLLLIVRAVRTVRANPHSQGLAVSRPHEDPSSELESLERRVGVADPRPRARAKDAMSWGQPTLQVMPKLPVDQKSLLRNSPEEIIATVSRNVRVIRVSMSAHSGYDEKAHCLGICGSWAVMNYHVVRAILEAGAVVYFRVGMPDSEDTGLRFGSFAKRSSVRVGDVIFFPLHTYVFTDIRRYFVDTVIRPGPAGLRGFFRGEEVSIKWAPGTIVADTLDEFDAYSYPGLTKEGMCGLPVFACANGVTCCIGIHSAGSEFLKRGFAHPVLSGLFLNMERVESQSILMPAASEGPVRLPDDSGVVGDLHKHSPFNYIDTPGLNVHGQLLGRGVPSATRSRVRSTPFIHHAERLLHVSPFMEYDGRSVPKYGAPCMTHTYFEGQYCSPLTHFLLAVGGSKPPLQITAMEVVVQVILDHVLPKLEECGVDTLRPISCARAVAGDKDDFYLRSVNQSTSAGYAFAGCKRDYSLPRPSSFAPDGMGPNEEIVTQVVETIEAYARGETASPLVGVTLKDEARPYLKVRQAKTRPFCMGDYPSLVVQRMFLAPFYTLMVEHGDVFGAEVGINMHSSAVDTLVHKHVDHSDNHIELDYSGFDTSQLPHVGLMANSVVYRTLEHFGYPGEALTCVRGCLTDNLFPLEVMEHVVFSAAGHQPSGRYATAEDNCLRNLVMVVYAWVHLAPASEATKFFDHVVCSFYGDDLWITVSDAAKEWLNPKSYASFCSTTYDIRVTDAQKGDVDDEFKKLSDLSFLKRRFVYRADVGHWVAPLEVDSIMKSLCFHIPSAELTEAEQLVETSISAMRELALHHDVDTYGPLRLAMSAAVEECTGISQESIRETYPSWEDIIESMYGVRPMDVQE